MTTRPAVLVIAGSDSGGGSGIARDLSTLAAHGADAAVAITAITAQTEDAVLAIHHTPPAIVCDQIKAAFDCRTVNAIKIGMLGCRATVEAVARELETVSGIPIVLDPVLASSSGRKLLDEPGRSTMVERLFPHVTLLTPNLPEAAAIAGTCEGKTLADIERQARAIIRLGPQAVLIKGGHGVSSRSVDMLFNQSNSPQRYETARLAVSMRGTGCILSTKISAYLASGESVPSACAKAKNYLWELLKGEIGA